MKGKDDPMKRNLRHSCLSLLLVLTCIVSTVAFSFCTSFAEGEIDVKASNDEPVKNEYQVVSPVPSGSSIVPITQSARLDSLENKRIALVGGSFSASVTHAVLRDLLEETFGCTTFYMTERLVTRTL